MSLSETTKPTRVPRRTTVLKMQAEAAQTPMLVTIFLMLLTVPAAALFEIGPVLLSPLRVFLLFITIPVVLRFFASTKLRSYDYLFLVAAIWYCLCHTLNYGITKGVQYTGVYMIQTVGVYAMVQVSIRRPEQIQSAFGVLFFVLVLLLPFALLESLTGERLIANFFGELFGTRVEIQGDKRLGLYRAATSFQHPILFGLFYASSFVFFWYALKPTLTRLMQAGVAAAGVFFSLSSAALLTLLLQIILVAGERVTRGIKRRVQYLFWSILGTYTFLETAANSGAFGVMANYLTFNPGTAYWRRIIWENGIDDVLRNPIFGFVTENWTRPYWLAASVDNFWLAYMMRSGLVGMAFLGLALFLIVRRMLRRPAEEIRPIHARMRLASLLSLLTICVAGATVAFFDKMEPIFAFYVALAARFARWEDEAVSTAENQERKRGSKPKPSVRRWLETEDPDEMLATGASAIEEERSTIRQRRRPHLATGLQRRQKAAEAEGGNGSAERRPHSAPDKPRGGALRPRTRSERERDPPD